VVAEILEVIRVKYLSLLAAVISLPMAMPVNIPTPNSPAILKL
jgi:hypothetical protein